MLEQIKQNLARIQQRIDAAAMRVGRQPKEVTMIAVTKYVDAEVTRLIASAGCLHLGENRPQQLWEKAEALRDSNIGWHLIGHLQTNKINRTIGLTQLIHSVDSFKLLQAIDRAAAGFDQVEKVLLEINISGEDAKHGLAESELAYVLDQAHKFKHVSVRGFMGMAGLHSSPEQTRREFARLRELLELHRPGNAGNVQLDELSMGMSNDFEVAIEEGATLIRIGSLLYEGIFKHVS